MQAQHQMRVLAALTTLTRCMGAADGCGLLRLHAWRQTEHQNASSSLASSRYSCHGKIYGAPFMHPACGLTPGHAGTSEYADDGAKVAVYRSRSR